MTAVLQAPVRAAILLAGVLAIAPASAQIEGEEKPLYPTTEFAEGATRATVTVGAVTAEVSLVKRPEIDPKFKIPMLTISVKGSSVLEVPGVVFEGQQPTSDDGPSEVLEVPGVASGFDIPAAEASIVDIDPDSRLPEVYFTSYSGGAHCCASVIVAEEVGDEWVAVPIGDFDGDGNFLNDADGDGLAEIVTVDNRFLYKFDCYACSAAPLVITTVRGGKAYDVTTEQRFQGAHRDWLKQIEDTVDPAERWTSPGYLAGWVAARARIGEFDQAWKELNAHWDLAKDEGEEVCLTGGEPEDCPAKSRTVLKFPERLKLFLEQTGYIT